MSCPSEFKSHLKKDAHNHLNLGMRYASYAPWAGFSIPNFPRTLSGLTEMHTIICDYTRPRIASKQDVHDLITMSLQDAIADGVSIIEGSIDIGFICHCDKNINTFLTMIAHLIDTFKDKIDFRPELGMGKTFDLRLIQKWAPECMRSGIFKSIDLYGPEVEEGITEFKNLFTLAEHLGIKKKAHIGEFSNAKSVQHIVEFFNLDEVQHGIGAATDDSVMKFLVDNNIQLNICPQSNVMLSAVPSLAEHPIKKLYEAGVPISIATDDLLFFDKTISEQCADLVTIGMFTKEQIFGILDKSMGI